MSHGVICHSDVFQEYAHVAIEITVFELLEHSICFIMILNYQVTQSPFMSILCQVLRN